MKKFITVLFLLIILVAIMITCFNNKKTDYEKNEEEILKELEEEKKIAEENSGEEIIMLQTKDDIKISNKNAKEDAKYFFDTYEKENGIEAFKNLSIKELETKIKNDIVDKRYADKYDSEKKDELVNIYFDILSRWTLNPYLSFDENREMHIYKLMDDLDNFYEENK
ncbi:MAG: hypothetical protein MJ245_04795 [Clostridia bacterium]|nr:hypothetical protein [Clostridia bacterium]